MIAATALNLEYLSQPQRTSTFTCQNQSRISSATDGSRVAAEDVLAGVRARTMAGSDNPFANADAWRKHPLLTGTWRAAAPGFFLGLAAFGCYYAFDKATAKKQAKH